MAGGATTAAAWSLGARTAVPAFARTGLRSLTAKSSVPFAAKPALEEEEVMGEAGSDKVSGGECGR